MKISILTLFPEMFEGPFTYSILKRAQEKNLVEIAFVNIRDFGEGKHKMVDDTPYGGGVGMVMKVDVLHKAIEHTKNKKASDTFKQKVILLTASGKKFKQPLAEQFSTLDHLILICGHYEGIDDRIKHYIDEEISIGDYVLTGGELPGMLITDAVVRLIPGVLPEGAADDESFAVVDNQTVLEYPHYTHPRSYDGHDVPEVLLSGDHAKIKSWKKQKALEKTERVRPDLLPDSNKQDARNK